MDSYDLEIVQGSTFLLGLTLKETSDIPLDLTDYTISGYLKYKYSDSGKLADLNVARVAPYASGGVILSISASDTSLLPITLGFYDIEIYHSGGEVTKILNGKANIFPQITQ